MNIGWIAEIFKPLSKLALTRYNVAMMFHRLFIGLRPDEMVRGRLIDMMEGIENARWQGDAQLHITLRFLGDLAAPDANDLAEALGRIRMSPFDVAIEGISHFERKGVPRALWAGLSPNDTLAALKKKIDHIGRDLGLPDDHRKFIPHITLARLNSHSGSVARFLARHGDLGSLRFRVESFTLFESHLGSEGSHYDPVETYPLD